MRRDDIPESAPIRQIHDWPTFFEQVRRRPGMWLGDRSPAALQLLIQGVYLAEFLYDVPEGNRLGNFPFQEFEGWVERRFNPRRLSVNSYWMARDIAGSDEEAFDLWFSWYDEFRSERGP